MKIYHLTVPHHNMGDPQFQCWMDCIGNGAGAGPKISLAMLTCVENLHDILDFVYPPHILADPLHCLKCSILAPMHCQVDTYDNTLLNQIHSSQRTYMASDSLKEVTAVGMIYPDSVLDYAAKQTPPVYRPILYRSR